MRLTKRLVMICLMLMGGIVNSIAQDEAQTPYDIALKKILEAEQTGTDVLWLSETGLTELPPEIGNLTSLKFLHLENNQLTNLPSEIGQLNNLRELRLGYNNFRDLPQEIGNLHKLCVLRLESNNLQHLPVLIGQLSLLTDRLNGCHLSFHDNPLITLPREVIVRGIPGILDYLNNQAAWHMKQMIASVATGVGLLIALILGLRWRMRRKYDTAKRKVKAN